MKEKQGLGGQYLILRHLSEAKPVAFKTLRVECTNGLGQVTEAGRVAQVQNSTCVIR